MQIWLAAPLLKRGYAVHHPQAAPAKPRAPIHGHGGSGERVRPRAARCLSPLIRAGGGQLVQLLARCSSSAPSVAIGWPYELGPRPPFACLHAHGGIGTDLLLTAKPDAVDAVAWSPSLQRSELTARPFLPRPPPIRRTSTIRRSSSCLPPRIAPPSSVLLLRALSHLAVDAVR